MIYRQITPRRVSAYAKSREENRFTVKVVSNISRYFGSIPTNNHAQRDVRLINTSHQKFHLIPIALSVFHPPYSFYLYVWYDSPDNLFFNTYFFLGFFHPFVITYLFPPHTINTRWVLKYSLNTFFALKFTFCAHEYASLFMHIAIKHFKILI